jgi:hypothetical protein
MKATSSSSSADAASVAARSELEPGERVHRHGVRLDAADVAEHDLGPGPVEDGADSSAEPREVVARDRAADRKGDELPPSCVHPPTRPLGATEIIVR